ncbi:MAG: MFS transporter [Pseudomonadota bacterium]
MALERNLAILFLIQATFTAGAVMLGIVGGVVGNDLAPHPRLATLPISLAVLGTALATVPTSMAMRRLGRRAGIALGAGIALVSALLAGTAVNAGSFGLFCLAATGLGAALACGQQLRFAAAESVHSDRAGQAIAWLLLGAMVGAVAGGTLIARISALGVEHPLRLAFCTLALGHIAVLGLVAAMRPFSEGRTASSAPEDAPRPLLTIARQPAFLLAVGAAVVAQGTMALLMTATPVAMHVVDGHPLRATAAVIQAHVVAMYAPSLGAALLIGRLGAQRMMWFGAAMMLACIAIGISGRAIMHYGTTLVLLGVGWNFLFVGATTALLSTYRANERFKAQAANDFSVFAVAALASLLAGATVLSLGWEKVLLLAAAPLLLILVLLVVAARRESHRHALAGNRYSRAGSVRQTT